MQKKKTGKLFGFCCESIAIIKEANIKKRNLLKQKLMLIIFEVS